MHLRSALQGCSSSQLSHIAAAWNFQKEPGTLRRELVEVLAERIEAGVADVSTWDVTDAMERRVLQLLAQAGGRHEADLLARRLGRSTPPDDAEQAAAQVDRAVAALVQRGLLYRVFDADEQRRGIYLVLPDEIVPAVRERLGEGDVARSPRPAAAPELVVENNLALDLFVLASALRRETWGAASRELAGRQGRSVGQIVGRLRALKADGPGDPGRRWRFLLWLCQRAGWVSRDGWPTPDEATVERLLASPETLPRLALAAGPVGQETRGTAESGKASPRQRQADALQLLSELDDGAWWRANDLVGWLADVLHGATRSTPTPRQEADRRRLEDQITRWLAGRWFWLGLVAWGADGTSWTVVSPTDALRSLATGRSLTESGRPQPCRATGHLRLEAAAHADLALLFQAERYLVFAGLHEDVRRYSLTSASFERGVRLGGDREEIESLLGRLLDGSVPASWSAALDAWSAGGSRLSLSSRLLLVGESERALAEALEAPGVPADAIEPLTPHHALVDGEQVAEVLAELARAGLPVQVDPGLRAEPTHRGRSAALANGVAETAWVALEVLRRLASDVVAEQRDLQAARGRLDAVLSAGVKDALDRRATAIAAAIANRRRSRARGRVV